MAIINPVHSHAIGGSYNADWATIYSIEFEPQVWKQWNQAFGKGFQVLDWLRIPGQTVNVSSRSITAFTDQAPERAALLNATGIAYSGHSAGATRPFTLATSE